MPYDVFVREENRAYPLYVLYKTYAFKESGIFPSREIDLGSIPGNYELCIDTHPGEEHLELRYVSVLGFVQDDTGAIQSPSSHICQRSYLYGSVSHEILKPPGRDHIS